MRNRTARASDVVVTVIDLKPSFEEIREKLNQNEDKKIDTLEGRGGKVGYVDTPEGLYVLCAEGVGGYVHNDYEAECYAGYDHGDGSKTIGMFPICMMRLQDDEIRNAPVLAKVNLAKFIRTFGSRLEMNFKLHNDELSRFSLVS